MPLNNMSGKKLDMKQVVNASPNYKGSKVAKFLPVDLGNRQDGNTLSNYGEALKLMVPFLYGNVLIA